jgi:hypothetical protein
MRSSIRLVVKLSVMGICGGSLVASLLPPEHKSNRLPVVIERVPDPPALACKQQAWPNADRSCLKWTARGGEIVKFAPGRTQDSGAGASANAPAGVPANAGAGAPAAFAAVPAAAPAAALGQDEIAIAADSFAQQTEPAAAREPQGAARPAAGATAHASKRRTAQRGSREALGMMRSFGDPLADVSTTGYAADPARRRTIRPTSIQDVYYYQRRGMLPPTAAAQSTR